MNITASYIRRKLQGRYDPREAGNLSRIICCEILGQQTVDYYLGKDIILSVKEEQELESILARLHNFEPIQYILGEECSPHKVHKLTHRAVRTVQMPAKPYY